MAGFPALHFWKADTNLLEGFGIERCFVIPPRLFVVCGVRAVFSVSAGLARPLLLIPPKAT